MTSSDALYDRIGGTYSASRRPDPRLARVVRDAIGDARSVVNVGAGTGAYEPDDLDVIAVERSKVMIAQRPAGSAPVIEASAEELPLADDSVEVAMAVISDHHWRDRPAGLRELRRVARKRVVLLNAESSATLDFWFIREYLLGFDALIPDRHRTPGPWRRELEELLGVVDVRVVPVPHDCIDGFLLAYWRRPYAYLDPEVRANISVFHLLDEAEVEHGIEELRRDLTSGAWLARHEDLLRKDELDVGLRLVVAEVA